MEMTAPSAVPDAIRGLLFSEGGLPFAVDMAAISEIRRIDQLDHHHIALVSLADRLGLSGGGTDRGGDMAIILADTPEPAGVVIGPPEAIDVAIPLDRIHPLPPLIEAARGETGPVWAAADIGGKLTLLVDIHRLVGDRAAPSETREPATP